jgi:crotonobetainyl-CoA:carnitine CoA-transferase CaiB-like acyl-CoA transferase
VAERPLAGRTVIDLTTALSGPYATLLLAGLGARVIKVENPLTGGDSSRNNAPYIGADGLTTARRGDDDMSVSMLLRGRNKQSVTLNLKHPSAASRRSRFHVALTTFFCPWMSDSRSRSLAPPAPDCDCAIENS